MKLTRAKRRGRGNLATSPAVSVVIITATIVVLVIVASGFAINLLWTRIAESEFESAKQFMQSVGLSIDDVAWTMGRTETIRYSSDFGHMGILPSALNYTVYVRTQGSGGYQLFASYIVGVLSFNLPVSKYSIGNGYYEAILPSQTTTPILKGASVPAVRVFGVEKLPMGDGGYLRVVVAPSLRFVFSNMTGFGNSTSYVKLYLPVLKAGICPRNSESVTLTGTSLDALTVNQVTGINITVSFPNEALGFDNNFFRFPVFSEELVLPGGHNDTVLELYAGEVTAALGVHP